MPALLEALENHGELVPGKRAYNLSVRSELLGMSAATIDRLDCHGVFGQWALLKWGFTESRDSV